MFSTAAWVLDQEYKAYKWLVRGFPKDDLSVVEQVFAGATITGWVGVHGYIASQPYARLWELSGDLDMIIREANMRHHAPFSFSPSAKGWVPRFAPKAGKMLVTKGLSRAVPYVGWALLGYDLWNFGKWIGSKVHS